VLSEFWQCVPEGELLECARKSVLTICKQTLK
jgi:hypothetical protein